MRAATLQIRLNNDELRTFTDVGYYVHRQGLDIVDPTTGDYLARFRTEEYEGMDVTKPAEAVTT